MSFKPLHDWVVIVPVAEEKTAGGLYIPDTAKEKPEVGIVEQIGPGAFEEQKRRKKEEKERKFVPAILKPGDRVFFERWAGHTYTIDNMEKILIRERHILGLLMKPLEIPAVTTSGSPTEMVERVEPGPVMNIEEQPLDLLKEVIPAEKRPAKKTDTKAKAKTKMTSERPAKKKAAKKAVKKSAKKTVKKAVKKTAKKAAKTAVKKSAKKAAAKTVKTAKTKSKSRKK